MSRRVLLLSSLTTVALLSISTMWAISSAFLGVRGFDQCSRSTATHETGSTTAEKELEVNWSDIIRPKLSPEKLYEEDDEDKNDLYWADVSATKFRIEDNVRIKMRASEANRTTVDRIYYINLPHRPARRSMMEEWLQKQPVPYQRIVPVRGTKKLENCHEDKREVRGQCQAVSSLSRTVVGIARDKNTTGLTLVLEDDFKLNITIDRLLEESFKLVPPDWDIIRWNCWGFIEKLIEQWHTETAIVARAIKSTPCEIDPECYFAGGTHAQLWRASSMDKLINIWAEIPYVDVDSRLSTPRLNSYCINFREPPGGFMHTNLPERERSDVPSA